MFLRQVLQRFLSMLPQLLAPPSSAVPEFSFDSGSVVRYQLRGGGSSRRTNIQLLLRTRATSGTLLSMASREANEYIVLEVRPSFTNQVKLQQTCWKDDVLIH